MARIEFRQCAGERADSRREGGQLAIRREGCRRHCRASCWSATPPTDAGGDRKGVAGQAGDSRTDRGPGDQLARISEEVEDADEAYFPARIGGGDGRGGFGSVLAGARRRGHPGQTQNPGGDFSARRGRRLEHGGAVRREALLRASPDHRRFRRPGVEWPNRGHRSRRPLRAESRAATAEGAVGPADAGDRGGHRLAGPVALALRRAGLHGIGHAGLEGRRMAESRAAAAGPGDFAAARHRHERHAAAHAARRSLGDRGERRAAVSRRRATRLHSREHVRQLARQATGSRRQGRLRRDEDDPVAEPHAVQSLRRRAIWSRAENWAAACSRSRG